MKRKMQKALVLLTILTMMFSSVPFAFADDNEPAENADLSTEVIIDEMEAEPEEDITDEETVEIIDVIDSESEEEENSSDDQKDVPLKSSAPAAPAADGESEHVHTAGEWVVTPASFDNDGSRKKTCTECGEVVEEEPIYMISDVSFDKDPAVYIFKDEPVIPSLTVRDSQGNALTQGVDYTIQFANNDKEGKAKAKVTLQGENYSGTKDFEFFVLNETLKRTNLLVGDTKAAVTKSITEALGSDITFSIADESIATVDASGNVTGVAAGKTVLTVKAGEYTFSGDVNVLSQGGGATLIEEVTEDDDDWCCSYDFVSDGTESFRVVVYGAWYLGSPYKAEVILWDEDIEIIKEIDIKKADLNKGPVTVEFDSSYFKKGYEYDITVWADTDDLDDVDVEYDTQIAAAIYTISDPEEIVFDETSYDMLAYEKQTIAYTSDGGNADAITWKSSDPSVASVSKGVVTAKAPGECTITATLPNGVTDTCKIRVTGYGELAFTQASWTVYGTATKKLTLVNQSAIVDTIKWTSSNTAIATIDSTGKLTPKKAGTVTITASVAATGKKQPAK